MAGEYDRRVRAQVSQVAVPEVRRDAVAEGVAAVGEGLSRKAAIDASADEMVATSQHQIAMEEKRRRDAHAATVWSGQNAEAELGLQQRLSGLRDASKAGADGHDDAVRDAVGEWTESQLAAIPPDADPEQRDRFQLVIQKSSARYRSDEFGWATEQRHKYEGEQAERFGASLTRDAYGGLTSGGVDVAMTKIDVFAANLDVPGNGREMIAAKLKRDYVLAGLDGLVDRGEDARVQALVKNPAFAPYLDDDDLGRYTRAAEAIGKGRAAQAEQAANEQQGLVRDSVNALKIRIDAGDVPSAAELRAASAAAARVGLPVDDQTRIGVMAVQANTARVSRDMDPAGRRRWLDGLKDVIQGGAPTQEQQIAYKALMPMVEKDERDQADKLRGALNADTNGKVQALRAIAGDGETRFNVAEKLKRGWGVLTLMPDNIQRAAFDGWQVKKDKPKDFGTEAQVRAAFGGSVGQALPNHWGDYMQVAWNAYAADMHATGDTGFNGERFRTITRMVTGAQQRGNGVLEGGIAPVRGKAVQLPDFMTASEFDAGMSRMSFGAAIGPDGAPARKEDILASMTPRYVRDNERGEPVYQWVDARNRPLRAQGRRVFEATFARPR